MPWDCMHEAMEDFAAMVRLLLGPSAVSSKKLECGVPLCVLGLDVDISTEGMRCKPRYFVTLSIIKTASCIIFVFIRREKVEKWCSVINTALAAGTLCPGMASKLAGGLSWACQNMFSRFGRALLRPIYAQQHKVNFRASCGRSHVSEALRLSLRWWLEVLALELVETKVWRAPASRPLQLYADARGQPPRLAAVLIDGTSMLYTDWEPHDTVLNFFRKRGDNQIMSLELLALALGLSTFSRECSNKRVRVFSDNAGAEHSARRGSAREWDHCAVVHSLWHKAAQLGMNTFIERVPTKDNISDLPSREQYELLDKLGASWRKPWLDDMFWRPDAWAALSLKKVFC